ncbi:MAG: globin [Actinobacteria bacterium]|nr:globin [Actinomycetota bacterium]
MPVPAPGRKPAPETSAVTVFEAVGGRPFFDALARRFYAGVAQDPVLRPLYPEDLTEPTRWLAGFLAQYWGGGVGEYSVERGHPRLRMRHMGFQVGEAEAEAWLGHMTAAVRSAGLPRELEDRFLEYFRAAALHLRNA